MPAVSRIKTYTKTRKNEHNYNYNYSSSSQNSFLFPITGASTAIDSLLAKNIEKRNSSIKETNKPKTRNEKKAQKEVRLLENDSFDLTINTTFEKLLKAPVFQPVNYYNISVLSGKNTTENSPVKNDDKHIFKVQKTYERKVKTDALSVGKKIKNTKTSKKNLLQLAKKVQKTPITSPDVYVARKFTPIASTSKLISPSPKINSGTVFQPGLRHCMQAQNSPNFLAASTPLIPRHLRTRHDFSLSPITAKKQLNFKSGWKSLFESDSLPSTSIKDNHATPLPDVEDEKHFLQNNSLVRNDLKFNAIPIVIIEGDLQVNNNNNKNNHKRKLTDDLKKMYSPRVDLTRNTFSEYTKKIDKLHQSPCIDLTRYSFSEYLNKKKQNENNESEKLNVSRIDDKNPNVSTNSIKMNLRSRSPTKNTRQTLDGQTQVGQKFDGQTQVGQKFDGQTQVGQTLDCQTPDEQTRDWQTRLRGKTNKIEKKPIKKTKTKPKLDNNVHGIGLRTRSHRLKTDSDINIKNISEAPRKARTMSLKTKTNIIIKENANCSPVKPTRSLRSKSVHLNETNSSNPNDSVFISNEEKTPNKIEANDEKPKRILRKRSNTISLERLSNIKEKNNVTSDLEKNQSKDNESIYIAKIIDELKKPLNIVNSPVVTNPIRRSSRARRKSVLIDEENYSDWGEFQRITQNKYITPNTSIDEVDSSQISHTKSPPAASKRQTRSASCLIINESNANTIINISDTSDKSLFSSPSTTNKIDIIENTLNETVSKPETFVTTRRGGDSNSNSKEKKNENFITRRRGNSKSTEMVDLNHQTISLHEWERFSQNNISTIKIDDADTSLTNDIIDSSVKNNNISVISDTFAEENLPHHFLKPGKQWLRSLSILRRTNVHNINLNNSTKGRKWRDSVCAIFDQQNKQKQQQQQPAGGGILIDTSDNQHNEIYNITKNLQISRINSLNRRTTLQIVPISIATRKEVSVCRNVVVSILEDSDANKTGYVSTLADESQSILASFDKLSLTTNVEEREETARQIILKRCGQTAPLPFDDCYSQRLLTRCRKIGEGVYGEVFMYKSLDRQCRVMKIIPIEGNLVVNGEHQKKFEEIISEIIIASELSNLRNNKEFSTNGFNELLKICCVQGKYPQHLLDLWILYDEEQGSENDSPEIFPDDQLYIVLELANGGQDLEAYRFNNAEQSFAVFAQVVCSLAVAESALQFEHRDMHWGNILISPTNETTATFRLNGRELEIATKGVNVSIIDFTLSRMTYNNCCIFNDLALDPDLFTATGDYQFDIYRLMRQRNQDNWQRFEPYSNILWLDYTLEKMITQLRYLRTNTKTHKTNIRRLTQMRKKIFNYNSATELLNSDAFSQVFLY